MKLELILNTQYVIVLECVFCLRPVLFHYREWDAGFKLCVQNWPRWFYRLDIGYYGLSMVRKPWEKNNLGANA